MAVRVGNVRFIGLSGPSSLKTYCTNKKNNHAKCQGYVRIQQKNLQLVDYSTYVMMKTSKI